MRNEQRGGCAARLLGAMVRFPFRLLSFLADTLISAVYYLFAGIARAARYLFGHGRRGAERMLDSITDGHAFEAYLAALLRDHGYRNVQLTKKSGDFGVDILADMNSERYAIQCKLYSAPVGNKAVQEAYAGRAHYGCDVAVVATNSVFTKAAVTMAETTGTELWDRDDLLWLERRRGHRGRRAAREERADA